MSWQECSLNMTGLMFDWPDKQICSCAECLPDVVVDLIKPMCSNAKLMSRDVDDSIAPPYAEYMAVTEDSVHHQAIRV
jgi:hypothetical protein